MDMVVDFVQENFDYFLIGGIILFMACIGYIAEKTNFGRSEFAKAPKQKKIKKIEDVAEVKDVGEIETKNGEKLEEKLAVDLSKTEKIDIEQIEKSVEENNKQEKTEEKELEEDDVWKF